ncbi:sulfonate ABC transporter permease [Bifidobacterium dolichotidis]|uniref:Sulfonate ABC transporter permease n=1 Tax=Bifidobacterium dolichotidis TaxID=2306976 RepID=A0A430FQI1_9BIFI|nr:ABC transporter permease subunit [Bifidobacterium dolichotidis]RSX55099.1 sulfonate ABC transporter permease [Bifidobacterium dolichotidis]
MTRVDACQIRVTRGVHLLPAHKQVMRIAADIAVVALIGSSAAMLVWMLHDAAQPLATLNPNLDVRLGMLPYYAMRSITRMLVALVYSLIFTLIVGTMAARCKRLGRPILLILDVLQSVPILGFLSATLTVWMALFPNSQLGVECAAVFAIFTSQVWNMTFSFHRSLISEPAELNDAARMFHLSAWQRFVRIDIPHAMVPLLWNCMMSVGGGWFFLTASELISVGNDSYTLPGIGSFVGVCIAQRNMVGVLAAIGAMAVIVIGLDLVLWKPLTAWAERFRMTATASAPVRSSCILNVIHQSHLTELKQLLLRMTDLPCVMKLRQHWCVSRATLHRMLQQLVRNCKACLVLPHISAAARKRIADVLFATFAGTTIAGVMAWFGMAVVEHQAFEESVRVVELGSLTFARVMLLTVLCSIIWIPVGVHIGMSPKLSRIAQPIVQLMASFPANFLFPFVLMWFLAWHINMGWGSLFLMALGTQWYILFNVIAGASQIPDDLREMMTALHCSRFQTWRKLILPAIFGPWVTGAFTAAGGAWNASVVSEAVTYGNTTMTARGLGAFITQATDQGDRFSVLLGVLVMTMFVLAVNQMLWRPLERLASSRYTLR